MVFLGCVRARRWLLAVTEVGRWLVTDNTPELPFDISKQSVGAQKAYKNFIKEYGQKEGTRIFLAKADEQGKGNTIRQKVNFTYHKGAKLGKAS